LNGQPIGVRERLSSSVKRHGTHDESLGTNRKRVATNFSGLATNFFAPSSALLSLHPAIEVLDWALTSSDAFRDPWHRVNYRVAMLCCRPSRMNDERARDLFLVELNRRELRLRVVIRVL
jgi:hypothetical protein